MTSMNNPKLSSVMGMVNSISSGFTVTLSNDNTTAIQKADQKLSTLTPGKI